MFHGVQVTESTLKLAQQTDPSGYVTVIYPPGDPTAVQPPTTGPVGVANLPAKVLP
jgi:hypothetical protein